MNIAIGSDHGGFELKEKIKSYLTDELHLNYLDFGTYNTNRCDYPDYAFLVAHAVATGKCDFGIMIDGAGIGSSMMANKVPGVLAACANEFYTARNSRHHNGANVLTLGSMVIGEGVAKEIVKVFLTTPFEGDRNKLRVARILEIEKQINRG
ncbi:MAG: ribose 5-phosphate isomerase B [Bacilli bacterium]|nr:ribose 5-phosphate isomerase B [Bacilli bacterium]